MLFKEPRLDAKDLEVLEMIRDLWRNLRHTLEVSPRKWTAHLAKTLRAKAIQGSNSIEGYVVSQETALAVLDSEMPTDVDPGTWLALTHYREAMDYILRLGVAPDFAYSRDLIRALHFIMTRHYADKNPGAWRPGYIQVVSGNETVYEGPPASEVSGLVQELCDYLTNEDGAAETRLIRAAMAHLNLVMIHPFSDGNGRMARALHTLVIARSGLLDSTFSSIEEHLGKNTSSYYEVLATVGQGSWNPKNSAHPWIRFCLKAHYQQARSAQKRLDRVARIWDEVEKLATMHALDDRAVPSLVNAAQGFDIRNESYRSNAGVAMHTASRDLNALVKAGLLEKVGAKRGAKYQATVALKAIGAKHRDSTPVLDPYA
tara:strand:+ start:26513 stop:27631 length:1119 start_codon:yes stop_codon:yes gene_type:complete